VELNSYNRIITNSRGGDSNLKILVTNLGNLKRLVTNSIKAYK